MPFITIDDIIGEIPDEWRDSALADSVTGRPPEEVWEKLQESVMDAIAGAITPAYGLPAADADPEAVPLVRIIRAAVRILTLCNLYRRRGTPDEQNPWAKDARDTMSDLRALGQREAKGPAGPPRTSGRILVIGEPSRLTPTRSGRCRP
jgi:hypothetical protein